jgi:DNA-binding MarR family transcriptional regulator
VSSFYGRQWSTFIKVSPRLSVVSTQAAREAWAAIHDLFVEGEAHDRVRRVCAELDLSPPLLKAFVHLGDDPDGEGLRMSDLAEHWRCDASWVTSLADGLEERGLAERRPHPTDRRVRTIVLTPEGRARRRRALEMLAEPPSAFGALSAAEQRQLRDLLLKLVAADPDLSAKPRSA